MATAITLTISMLLFPMKPLHSCCLSICMMAASACTCVRAPPICMCVCVCVCMCVCVVYPLCTEFFCKLKVCYKGKCFRHLKDIFHGPGILWCLLRNGLVWLPGTAHWIKLQKLIKMCCKFGVLYIRLPLSPMWGEVFLGLKAWWRSSRREEEKKH